MRILFICQRVPYPPNKGEKIRTFNQIKYLLECGHRIEIICPTDTNKEKVNVDELKKALSLEIQSASLQNKFICYVKGLLNKKPISISYFYTKKMQQKIDDSADKFDLIFCSASSMTEYYFQSKQLKNKPLVTDLMDLDSDKWKQYAEKSIAIMKWVYQREHKLLKEYEKSIQKRADYCFFTTDKEVELFKKNIGNDVKTDNVITVGNGLDNEYFQPNSKTLDKKNPVFIFTGVMDYKPNIDAVMWFCDEVWESVLKFHPNAKFIISGMKPTAKIKNLAKLQGVEVTGFVEDIRDYYKQADFFVAPLRIARGVQNKVLEAFACKLPVITTPNAIQGIECKPEEHCLQATTADEFIAQIQRLMEDKELRERLSDNALKLIVDKYSWEGRLQKLDKLINTDFTKEERS